MIQNGMYLAHHGILGQKWGKKNGPPYPLDYNKLSPEEREEAKKNAIDRGDINEATKNVKYFSNQEINQVIDRFNTKQRLSQLNSAQIKTGMQKAKEIANTMGTIADVTQKGTNLYNNMAKISNALTGTSLPIIGESKKDVNDNVKTTNIQNIVDGVVKSETKTTNKNGNITTKNYTYTNNDSKDSSKKDTKAEADLKDRQERIKKGASIVDSMVKSNTYSMTEAINIVDNYPGIKVTAKELADEMDYIPIHMNGETYYEKKNW